MVDPGSIRQSGYTDRFALDRAGAAFGWDMRATAASAQARLGWNDERCQRALTGYRQFLALISLNPHKSYGMAGDADEIWHEHLDRPDDYSALCDVLVGGFIEHEPLGADSKQSDAYETITYPDLVRHFSESAMVVWPAPGSPEAATKCCRDHVTTYNS